ncbi:MAG: hypothetical protein GY832_43070, partial [Chloroflexi bacterium]|nr:hypothetical protein [Chloroflexota bacterium]
MRIKNRKGMETVLTAAVTTDETKTIIFASLIGAQTAVKAIWASILNRRSILQIGHKSYCTGDPNVEYLTLKQSPAPGVHHWVMLPEPGPDALFLLMIPLQGMTEQEQLVKLLNHHTLWPVRDMWAEELWNRGVVADDEGTCLIQELKVHGELGWAYAVNTIGWDDVID